MADATWQALSKVRRAAVYRAIGRASRLARQDSEATLAADLRVALDLLRSHARAAPKRKRKR